MATGRLRSKVTGEPANRTAGAMKQVTADSAIVEDWQDAVRFALAGSKATSLTDSQAYGETGRLTFGPPQ